MNEATATDDSFHTPASADPFWTETSWFGFSIPERRLSGAVYPVFRANQGVCSSGVYVWDDTAESAHEILYARNYWHLPMPEHDLTALELPSGLRYETVTPLQHYRVHYTDGDELTLELDYRGLHAPHAPMVGPSGHLDQACHVTGRIVLHGEELAVDCHEMRDRSWSVRRDSGLVRAGYSYAIAADRAVLAMTMVAGDEEIVLAGYHWTGGDLRPLTGGTRRVTRDGVRPQRIRLELTDSEGTEIVAEGECRNRFAFQSSPNYFAWMSLTEWEIDGATYWGEDQDVWSPDLLRQAQRTDRKAGSSC